MLKFVGAGFLPAFLVGVVALSAVAAGCGGDDAKTTASQAPATQAQASTAAATQAPATQPAATSVATTAVAPTQVLQLAATEAGDKYTFSPASLAAKTGAVTVHYTNTAGNVRQHTFELKTLDGTGDIFKSVPLDSGSSADFSFTVPGPGTYQFICFQRGHVDRGQTGTLVVTAQ